MKKKTDSQEEFLDSIPQGTVDFMEDEYGLVILKVPRFRSRIIQHLFRLLRARPWYRLHLDEKGSFIWKMCDGNTSVRKICQALEEEFGESVQPSQERTTQFLKQLYRYRVIRFYRLT